MREKKFKLSADQIEKLIEPMGSCVASDKITVDGFFVGYMYREESNFSADSGWRFFSGTEEQEYVDNPDNLMFYDLNTIANYDPAIIPYLPLGVGSELERGNNNTFRIIKTGE